MKAVNLIPTKVLFIMVVGIFLPPGAAFAQNAHLGTETELTRAMQQNAVKDRKDEFGPTVKVDKHEEAAYQAFLASQNADAATRIQLGEKFVTQFPNSPYLPGVYGILTSSYFTIADTDRMLTADNRAIQLDPTNVDVMSLLAMAISRRVKSSSPGGAEQLQAAEVYAHRAIELIPAMKKPAKVDAAAFEKARNDKLALAHSGLGMIAFNHQEYDKAKTELIQAVQLASVPDPVDYFLLGNADSRTGEYEKAAVAFEKCSDSGPLVADCITRGESARRDAEAKVSH